MSAWEGDPEPSTGSLTALLHVGGHKTGLNWALGSALPTHGPIILQATWQERKLGALQADRSYTCFLAPRGPGTTQRSMWNSHHSHAMGLEAELAI